MKNWEKKKLGEVCIVERGSSPRPIEKYQTDSPDGVNWIKIGDTKGVDKYIVSTREKITKEGAEKSRYVKEGDFILSNSMSFGKPYIMKTDGYIHDGWFVFRLPDYIDKDYFYHLLTSPNVQEQIQSLGAGAIVKNISGDLVKRVDVTYPKSLPEQQRIVAILDEAFAAIAKAKANAEQNLKNAKELFESYLQGVFEKKGKMSESGLIGLKDEQDLKSNQKKILKFSNLENPDSDNGEGWEEKTLKEVCAKITDGTHQTPKYFDDGVIFLSSKNVTSGKIDWDNIKYIDEKQHLEMHKRVAPKVGDILLAKNGTTGVAAMVDRDLVFDIYVSLAHIRVLDEVTPDFMLYFINSPVAKKQFNKRLKGSGVPNLHLEEIREVVIPFPKSIKEQNKIVQKLNDFSSESKKLEAIYQQKINDLEELKKSVLQKAFSGELETEKTHHK